MVMVAGLGHFDWNQIKLPMAYATFSRQLFGKGANIFRVSAKEQGLQAIIVIQMDMHGRHHQVMSLMLKTGQALGQMTFMVVIDIGKAGDAVGGFIFFEPLRFKQTADDIAHGLGTVGVTAFPDQFVKVLRQGFIKGNRNTIHGILIESGWKRSLIVEQYYKH